MSGSESSEYESDDNPAEDISPTSKRVKSQPPDVIVSVGSDDNVEEFECYGVVLSFASPVFDAMLSTEMREKNDNCIKLPDRIPKSGECSTSLSIRPRQEKQES